MPKHPLSPPIFPHSWATEWGEDQFGLWQTLLITNYSRADEARAGDSISATACYVFRWIPPGTFWMGSPENEIGRYDDEDYHQVTMTNGFWMGETPVTQTFYRAVSDSSPSHFKGDNLPVEQVSWDDAQGFIKKLSSLAPLLKVRLPWEAEWEYACRAGAQTAFHFGNELSLDLVNYRGTWSNYENWGRDATQATTPVKKYLCNVWGLYDMHGNVWEWCEDVWQEHLSSKENSTLFPNDASNQPLKQKLVRVLRGGAWSYSGRYVRSAVRRGDSASLCSNCIGFRLILSDV